MDDPFAGPHWQKGYNEEVSHGWTDSESDDSDGTRSNEEEEVLTPDSRMVRLYDRAANQRAKEERAREEAEDRLRDAKEVLERLQEGSYWKGEGVKMAVDDVAAGLQGWRSVNTGK